MIIIRAIISKIWEKPCCSPQNFSTGTAITANHQNPPLHITIITHRTHLDSPNYHKQKGTQLNTLGESGVKQNSFTNSFITSAIYTLETWFLVAIVVPQV